MLLPFPMENWIYVAPGDISTDHDCETPINETSPPLPSASACTDANASDRRSSRDIGIQAFSLEIEEEKKKLIDDQNATATSPPTSSSTPLSSQAKTSDIKRREFRTCK